MQLFHSYRPYEQNMRFEIIKIYIIIIGCLLSLFCYSLMCWNYCHIFITTFKQLYITVYSLILTIHGKGLREHNWQVYYQRFVDGGMLQRTVWYKMKKHFLHIFSETNLNSLLRLHRVVLISGQLWIPSVPSIISEVHIA